MEAISGAAVVMAVAFASTAFIRYLIVRTALKDTEPKDRPRILVSLAPMFQAEWNIGPLRRQRPGPADEQPVREQRGGGSENIAPTDGT